MVIFIEYFLNDKSGYKLVEDGEDYIHGKSLPNSFNESISLGKLLDWSDNYKIQYQTYRS
jgi:hypothetical protein